jgi:hypothetical protein
LFGVRIRFLPHAWQHGITGDEMRTVIAYPLLRYAIITPFPEADSYMFVGRTRKEPWIEVVAEDEGGSTWAVFHAMLLTSKTANDVYGLSRGGIDLRDQVVKQRPFIGPQFRKES